MRSAFSLRFTDTQLAEATEQAFVQHPDAAVLTSFPGVGGLTAARVLAGGR